MCTAYDPIDIILISMMAVSLFCASILMVKHTIKQIKEL